MKRVKIMIVATLAISLLTTSMVFADTTGKSEAVKTKASAVQQVTEQTAEEITTPEQKKITKAKARSIFYKRVPKSSIKYIKLVRDFDDGREEWVYKGKAVN